MECAWVHHPCCHRDAGKGAFFRRVRIPDEKDVCGNWFFRLYRFLPLNLLPSPGLPEVIKSRSLTNTEPRGIMKQAAEDLAQGLVDTDARNTPGISEAVDARPGATGQANPQPDRHRSMRDHDSVEPVPGKNR